MEKKRFKEMILEEMIFNKEKDKNLYNAEKFRKKYKDYPIDHTRLYTRIINYQVKTYGMSISSDFVNIVGGNPYIVQLAQTRKAKQRRDRSRWKRNIL